MIVGAPEDDSEQAKVGIEKAGAVYRCQTRMPFRCDQIPFDTSGNSCPNSKLVTLLELTYTNCYVPIFPQLLNISILYSELIFTLKYQLLRLTSNRI